MYWIWLVISGGLLEDPCTLSNQVFRGGHPAFQGPGPLGPPRNSTTGHVTIRLSMGHFLSVVLWTKVSISNGFQDILMLIDTMLNRHAHARFHVMCTLMWNLSTSFNFSPHIACSLCHFHCAPMKNKRCSLSEPCWNISQSSVATHLMWGGISLLISLLQISNWVRRWKICENRSIFSKDMDKSIVSPFFDSRCISRVF